MRNESNAYNLFNECSVWKALPKNLFFLREAVSRDILREINENALYVGQKGIEPELLPDIDVTSRIQWIAITILLIERHAIYSADPAKAYTRDMDTIRALLVVEKLMKTNKIAAVYIAFVLMKHIFRFEWLKRYFLNFVNFHQLMQKYFLHALSLFYFLFSSDIFMNSFNIVSQSNS